MLRSVLLFAAIAALAAAADHTTDVPTNTTDVPTTDAPVIDQPKLSTRDGSLVFSVTRDQDVTFQRARSNEEVTLWSVHDGIQALKGEGLDEVEARVMAHADARLTALKSKIAAIYARQFEAAAAALQSSVGGSGLASLSANANSRIGLMETRLSEYGGQVKNTIAAATAGLKDSLAGITSDIQAVKSELSKRTGEVNTAASDLGDAGVVAINKLATAAVAGVTAVADDTVKDIKRQTSPVQVAADSLFDGASASLDRVPSRMPWTVMSIGHMNDGRDNAVLRSFQFTKKFDDTALQISWNGDARMIGSGNRANWYFRVDNADCRCPNGDSRCHIDTSFHGSQHKNQHRPMMLDGVCFRTTSGEIKKGLHTISFHVSANGDAYTGWNANNRFTVREIPMPLNLVG